MRYLPFALLLLVAPLVAQEPKPVLPPGGAAEVTEAEKKFDAGIRSVEKQLRDLKAYSVDVTCEWTSKGNGPDRQGTNNLRIAVEGHEKVRIDSVGAGDGSFSIVGDGKTLTRLVIGPKVYNQTPTAKALEDLQTDNLTRHALKGSGVDFLLRTDMIGTIHAQTRSINDLGIVARGKERYQAFRLNLADGRVVDVLVTLGTKPIPVEIKTTVSIPLAEKRTFELVLNTKLTWNLTGQLAPDMFTLALPDGARAVNDLTEALLEGDVATLIGKPAPALSFVGLDGEKVDLASFKGKHVVVVYFWATWAAPSIRDMPGLRQYVADYSARGVKFLSVAVGDKPEDVKAWVAKNPYPGTIAVDEKATMLAALKTNALPSGAIIAKDGTLAAFHRGGKAGGTREQMKKELEKLLGGE